ncbi:MAG: hypothetical protein LC808_18810, partial [Actinobacteria bacterium]|nr:hypothetical protein [Actinomycetota bacterium]
ISTNALSKNPLFISTTANVPSDPIHRGRCGGASQNGRCGNMFDFLDLVVSPLDGRFWGSIVDTCTDDCVTLKNPKPDEMQGVAVRQLSGPRLVQQP